MAAFRALAFGGGHAVIVSVFFEKGREHGWNLGLKSKGEVKGEVEVEVEGEVDSTNFKKRVASSRRMRGTFPPNSN